jgi:hypothetical protein
MISSEMISGVIVKFNHIEIIQTKVPQRILLLEWLRPQSGLEPASETQVVGRDGFALPVDAPA